MKRLTLFILLFFSLGMLCAQDFNLNPTVSPDVHPDGSVTFRLDAPQAKSVQVRGQFMSGATDLVKGADGIWSVTVKPNFPDIYPYEFVVDGVKVADPGNPLLFPNESFKSSLLEMPNPEALYTVNDVPHGKVHYCTYQSHVLRQNRNMLIYTPAEYDYHPEKSYPVFYLVSGTTDTEETWYKAGRAHTILDNLIARKQAVPMIIVMPYGYMNNGTPRPNTMEAAVMYDTFARELTECIMPYVEKNYRTLADREHRAIAGFSRGGGQSMFAALKHIDKFAWLGSYSAYLTPQVMEKYFPNLKEDANSLRLLWFGVGKSDFLYNDVVKNQQYFDEKGICYQAVHREGSHTWMHARYCLAETLKKFFRNGGKSEQWPHLTLDDSSLPGFTIYRPTDMKAMVASKGRLPVVVWGNGACSHNPSDYDPMLAELVANGYIVIAIGSIDGKRKEDKEDNLLEAVDWICKQNVTPWSDYYRLIDSFHIAVAGHSCGGAQAMAVSYDPRISTTIMCNSGMGNMQMAGADSTSLEHLHAPILYLIGGAEDVAYPNAEIDYTRINHVPVALINYNVGHAGTYKQAHGGVLGQLMLSWLDWQLRGDKNAARYFKEKKYREAQFPGGVFQAKGF